jgi:hypothetical protein
MPMKSTYTTLNGQFVYGNQGGIRSYYGASGCVASIVEPAVPPIELFDCPPKTDSPLFRIFGSFGISRDWMPKNKLGELN